LCYNLKKNWLTFTKLEMIFMRLHVGPALCSELPAVGNNKMAGAETSVIEATLATFNYALESNV
jgi:hypothetical protein